ncbi:MAG: copper oxidase [Coriobacteriaceae bacterium]|nr:copper oxidase [Coriobacteriaceae bacterium]
MDRRTFVKIGVGVGAGMVLPVSMVEKALAFALPQPLPLNPLGLAKYLDALPIAPAIDATAGGTFHIEAKPNKEVVSSTMAAAVALAGGSAYTGTNVWSYRAAAPTAVIPGSGSGATYLGPSFVIRKGVPIQIKWYNNLTAGAGGTGAPIPHPMPVDPSLHWADPLGDSPTPPYVAGFGYTLGAVPLVPHVHGGEVPGSSDGGPDAWWTPGMAQMGPTFAQAGTVGTDNTLYPYYNGQPAATIWYHDHALGITRLNVYMGLAGAYVITDPGNEPVGVPTGAFDVPLVIQDRIFDINGQLYFPALSNNPAINPFWVPEFFGDTMMVNGAAWPKLDVKRAEYRFRVVNGSSARFYELYLYNPVTKLPGPAFRQIATDGGYLAAPVTIDPALGQRLVMGPGERAEIVVDFSAFPAGTKFVLRNTARAPYPAGAPADPQTTGQIMQFVVSAGAAVGPTTPLVLNSSLATYPSITDPVVKVRSLTLNEWMGVGTAGPLGAFLNNTVWPHNGHGAETEDPKLGTTEVWEIINATADTHPIHLHLVQFQPISRQRFSTKYYKAYVAAFGGMDPSMMPTPPMGPPYDYNTFMSMTAGIPNLAPYTRTLSLSAAGPVVPPTPVVGGNPDVTPFLQGPVMYAPPNERGWKDTVRMNPGEVTRILVRFKPVDGAAAFPFDATAEPGYVWHCHIIDHEDNEMMRPYHVKP